VNTTKFPRHPYRTRANFKTMEDWENAHEEVKEEISQVKGEISQIKDQMGQILEALRTMKSSGESSAVDGGTSYPPRFHPHVSSGPSWTSDLPTTSSSESRDIISSFSTLWLTPRLHTSNGRVCRAS